MCEIIVLCIYDLYCIADVGLDDKYYAIFIVSFLHFLSKICDLRFILHVNMCTVLQK